MDKWLRMILLWLGGAKRVYISSSTGVNESVTYTATAWVGEKSGVWRYRWSGE
jgi:hypothetical protein